MGEHQSVPGRHRSLWRRARDLCVRRVAVDLGSANLRVRVSGTDTAIDEESIVVVDGDKEEDRVLGVCARIWCNVRRRNLQEVRPIVKGKAAALDLVEEMMRWVLQQVGRGPFGRAEAIVGASYDLCPVERRALLFPCLKAGFRRVSLFSQEAAAAIGAGLAVESSTPQVIIDIGTTTKVMAFAEGRVRGCEWTDTGTWDIALPVIAYMKDAYSLQIGERTAERVLAQVGSAHPASDSGDFEIRGRCLVTGLPRATMVTSGEVREAISAPLAEIAEAARTVLGHCQSRGGGSSELQPNMVLSGGGALLHGLDQYLSDALGVHVRVCVDPLRATIRGLLQMLDNPALADLVDDNLWLSA